MKIATSKQYIYLFLQNYIRVKNTLKITIIILDKYKYLVAIFFT